MIIDKSLPPILYGGPVIMNSSCFKIFFSCMHKVCVCLLMCLLGCRRINHSSYYLTAPDLVAQLSPSLVTGDSRRDPISLMCTASVAENVILASYQFTWFKDGFPLDMIIYINRVSIQSGGSP